MTQVYYSLNTDPKLCLYVDSQRNTHELGYQEAHEAARRLARMGYYAEVHLGSQIVARFGTDLRAI